MLIRAAIVFLIASFSGITALAGDERHTLSDTEKTEIQFRARIARNVLADPYLAEKVAAKNNMTSMRFYNQSQEIQEKLIWNYIVAKTEELRVKSQTTLPPTSQQPDAAANTDVTR